MAIVELKHFLSALIVDSVFKVNQRRSFSPVSWNANVANVHMSCYLVK